MPDVFDSVFKSSAALPAFTANAPSPPATAAPSLDNGASAWPAAVIFPPTSWNCDPSLPSGDIAASVFLSSALKYFACDSACIIFLRTSMYSLDVLSTPDASRLLCASLNASSFSLVCSILRLSSICF